MSLHVDAPEFEAGQTEEELDELVTEETFPAGSEDHEAAAAFDAQSAAEVTGEESAEEEPAEAEASHRVDPASPTGFRLLVLARRRKTEDEAKPASGTVPVISSYAPGTGLIEEEVIEGEEFETVPHHRRHKTHEHDLDEYEEETLPTQIRSGDLGEMLQEAHLDHRIQLNFDEKNGEEESLDEDEDEDEATAETQPAHG